jgi:Uma2 family endonuclease
MSTIAATWSHAEGRRAVTPDELLKMRDASHYELVDDALLKRPTSLLASRVEITLGRILDAYCDRTDLGWVLGASCGYRCFAWKPRQIRRPDSSFSAGARLPAAPQWSEGYVETPPDLAVEVTSPSDEVYALEAKVEEYLGAGVRLISVIHPEVHAVEVIRADRSGNRLQASDELSDEDVVPGFRCSVTGLFPAAQTLDAGETVAE